MQPVSRLILSIMCLISKLKQDRIRCFLPGPGHAETCSNSFRLLTAKSDFWDTAGSLFSWMFLIILRLKAVQFYLWKITQQYEGDHPAQPGAVHLPFGHVTTPSWFTSCRSGMTEGTLEPCHQSVIKTIYKQLADVRFALKRKPVLAIALD